jgi:transcriptional regulator with XRE-family HTH domain
LAAIVTLRVVVTTYKGLGEAIRAKVAEKGVTLEKASLDLGLAPNALSRWNTGIEPRAEHYVLPMKFLRVTLPYLGALIVEDQFRRRQRSLR